MAEGSGETGLTVVVRRVRREAADIRSFELVDPAGDPLPPFTAGAHVDVHLPDGLVRQYSLANDPAERHRYLIGVLREAGGRGGSLAMHDRVKEGDRLTISAPRNNFPLAEETGARHLLLAGGIGVTPMMAMVAALRARGEDFTLHYCTRGPENTAFSDALAELVADGRVVLHHDGGDPSKGLDLAATLADRASGTHVYYCGPAGFMAAAEAAASHWPKGTVHFEYFVNDGAADTAGSGQGFEVRIASTGATFFVPEGKSIIQVLGENGIDVETSCESGLCGTCTTRYLEGEVEHHDVILDDEEHEEFMTLCCSRAKSPVIVLDL
jgi:ferredoxin-NADP reductase